jgi:hypothetical protein
VSVAVAGWRAMFGGEGYGRGRERGVVSAGKDLGDGNALAAWQLSIIFVLEAFWQRDKNFEEMLSAKITAMSVFNTDCQMAVHTIQANLPKIRLFNSAIYNQVKGPFQKEMFTDDVSNHGLKVMPAGLFADSF